MLMKRHPANPILRRNPDQPWEAGSVLNGTVVRGADGVIHMLYRATNGVEFSTAGEYVSSIGIADSTDGVHFVRRAEPLIAPDQPYEHGLGCEDPRVVFLDGEYYIYYTAVEGTPPDIKVRIALATHARPARRDRHQARRRRARRARRRRPRPCSPSRSAASTSGSSPGAPTPPARRSSTPPSTTWPRSRTRRRATSPPRSTPTTTPRS